MLGTLSFQFIDASKCEFVVGARICARCSTTSKATRAKQRAAPLLSPVDFVTDNAADRRTADRSDCAAARENSTSDSTDPSADRGVPVLRRHPGTTRQAEHCCCNKSTNRKPLHRFHRNTSIKKEH
jgi:hypothetical protein